MPRRPAAATLALFFALAAGGCKRAPGAKHDGTAASPWVIGVSQCNLGEPWRVQMNDDLARAAAAQPGTRLVFKDAQNNSLTQRAQVEELVDEGVDALIVSPKEAAPLTAPVADAFRKGIPVVVLDRAVEGDAFSCFIGADNVAIGREAGRWAAAALAGTGKIVELEGLLTSTPGQDRHRGFREGLDLPAHPGLAVVFEADMQWLEPNARKEMDSALASQPHIDLVFAHNDPGAHGAYLAARQAGLEKGMRFVGIDALPHEGVRYVKDGLLDATFAYPTGGPEAIAAARSLLSKAAVPKKIVLGTRRFTRENVDRGGDPVP